MPLILQHRITFEGRLIFCREKVSLADFIEYVIKKYPDFMIDMNQFYLDYEAALIKESEQKNLDDFLSFINSISRNVLKEPR